VKFKQWRQKVSVLVFAQIAMLFVTVSLPLVQWNVSAHEQWDKDLQQLKVQKSQLVNALNILKEHRHITQAINVSTETIDSITLSLIEAIKHQAHSRQLELTQLTVKQSDEPQIKSETDESIFHALRVTFALTTDRARELLPLFDALTDAAGWRPMDVHECSIVRLAASPVSLHANCSVDVYYFPEVDREAGREAGREADRGVER